MCKNRKKLLIIGLLIIVGVFAFTDFASALFFKPQVEIPGSKYAPGKEIEIEIEKGGGAALADYLSAFYDWAIGAIIVIGIVMIMFAGFQWMTAAGGAPKITAAKERITSALIGILLAVGSYAILNFINPSLVRLRNLSLTEVTKEGSTILTWAPGALSTSTRCKVETVNDGVCWDFIDESYKDYKDNAGPGWKCVGGACLDYKEKEVICCKFIASSCDEIKDEFICEHIGDPLCIFDVAQQRCYGQSRAEWENLYKNIKGSITYIDSRWVEKVMLVASYYSNDTKDWRWQLSEVDSSPSEKDNDYSVEVYVPIHADLSKGVYGLLWVVVHDGGGVLGLDADDKYCVGLNNAAYETSASTKCIYKDYLTTSFPLLTDKSGQDLQINLNITAENYKPD